MIKAVIFDLDGTIADTIDDIADGVNSMLRDYGFPTLTRAQALANINNGAFQLIRRSLPEKYRDNEPFVRECLAIYESYYEKCYDNRTYPYNGIVDTLSKISKSVPIAVLSNKQDLFVKNIVKKLFPDGIFTEVLGQGQFPPKPDPTAILYVCEKLGVKPEECALVGDSNVDMLTAKNSGVHAVGVTWGYRSREMLIEHGAELLVDEPSELVRLVNYDFDKI